jgi:hypothetical protein
VHRGQQVNRPCGCDHDPFVFGHLHFKGMYVTPDGAVQGD